METLQISALSGYEQCVQEFLRCMEANSALGVCRYQLQHMEFLVWIPEVARQDFDRFALDLLLKGEQPQR